VRVVELGWMGDVVLWAGGELGCGVVLEGAVISLVCAEWEGEGVGAGVVARTAFYNNLDLATNLLGAALQLSVTPWLLVRRGAGWGLVLPALVNVALLGAVALIGSGSVSFFGHSLPLLLAVMLVITRGFAYGMTKPAVDALYTRVPREMRYKGKNFVETAVWRFGDLVV